MIKKQILVSPDLDVSRFSERQVGLNLFVCDDALQASSQDNFSPYDYFLNKKLVVNMNSQKAVKANFNFKSKKFYANV